MVRVSPLDRLHRPVIYLAANVIDCEVLAARPAGGDSKAWLDHPLAAGTGNLVIAHPGLALPLLFVRFFHPRKSSSAYEHPPAL